jgi:tRNA threonylcarbamoyladenosine biosynthesis protein TsaB
MPSPNLRLLALETSTDTVSVALGSSGLGSGGLDVSGAPTWQHTGPGAAQASLTLLPVIGSLLAQAGWQLAELDALVFARGPGSFTGLRTACAVVQGLAYGTRSTRWPNGLPVLAVDTLAALAEEARFLQAEAGLPAPQRIAALLDARMGEMYVAAYRCTDGALVEQQPPRLCAPKYLSGWWRSAWSDDAALGEDVNVTPSRDGANDLLAGNVFEAYGAQFTDLPGRRQHALPSARALLRLAPAALSAGAAVSAYQALPLYVRDKVAQTTAEREQLRRQQLDRQAAPVPVAPLDT